MSEVSESTVKSSVEDRLAFMQLSESGRSEIRSLKSVVERELPHGLDLFYDQLRKTPEVKRFFSSEDHVTRAKLA